MEIPDDLVAAKQAVEWDVLDLPGVQGIGLGVREEGGDLLLDEVAVRVLLQDDAPVPDGLPTEIGGAPVCVVRETVVPCAFPDRDRYDDLVGGVMITQPSRGSGTLAVLVEDRQTGLAVGLSAYHVVGDPGQAFPFTVWQPTGPLLVVGAPPPSPADSLGEVLRVEFPRTPAPPPATRVTSTVDAAVLAVTDSVMQGRTLQAAIAGQGVGQPPFSAGVTATAVPVAGVTQVSKRGWVTGITSGLVLGLHTTVRWTPGGPDAYLTEQVDVLGNGVFAREGDSGALVLISGTDTAVGLLYGVNAQGFAAAGTRAVLSLVGEVESLLGVSVVLS